VRPLYFKLAAIIFDFDPVWNGQPGRRVSFPSVGLRLVASFPSYQLVANHISTTHSSCTLIDPNLNLML
jgi:hypothetical protein